MVSFRVQQERKENLRHSTAQDMTEYEINAELDSGFRSW